MDIYKRFIELLIITIILFTGCNNLGSDSVEASKLKQENFDLRKQAQNRQQLLDNWFNDFSEIQEQINSVNTDEILRLEYGLEESILSTKNDKEKLLNKINEIKALLNKRENQLKNGDLKYSGLYKMISNLRTEIEKKEKIIYLLKKENVQIKEHNEKITTELEYKASEVTQLEKTIKLKDLELNKKYLFLISSKETKISEMSKNAFTIDYKLNDIEVLTYHPTSSFNLAKYGKMTKFKIYNEPQFWNESNRLIIRIKKRHL